MTASELNIILNMFGISGVGAIVIFVSVKFIFPILKRTKGLFETWESFIQDWGGEEARPGRSRIPGVMERLNEIDGALKNNGGSSVKDAVDRIEIKVQEIDDRLFEGDKKFDDIYKHIRNIEKNN